jgi:hypothetical protein
LPLILQTFFSNPSLSLSGSLLELQRDALLDLLDQDAVIKSPKDLKKELLTSPEQAMKLFRSPFARLLKGCPQTMNIACSRYHLMYQLFVKEEGKRDRTVQIWDLRAPERSIGTHGTKETKKINQSIGTLGNVITALGRGAQHIPFRDHILTQLMKPALTDKSFAAVLFVNIPETIF